MNNKSFNNHNDCEISPISHIQVTLISPEEIKRRSVVHITKYATYYNGTEPIPGGLFDKRMGVLDNYNTCLTDGLGKIESPQHFGHIELTNPVYYVQFMKDIIDILYHICYVCGSLLFQTTTPENIVKIQRILKLPRNRRKKEIYKLIANESKNGDIICKNTQCNCQQPSRYYRNELMICYTFKSTSQKNNDLKLEQLTAEYIYYLFRKLPSITAELLGFDSVNSRPEWLICVNLPVCPPAVRPSAMIDNNQRCEDDLTHKYADIIRTNEDLKIFDKKIMEQNQECKRTGIIELELDKKNLDKRNIIYNLLQYHVAVLIDNSIANINQSAQRNGRIIRSLRQRLKAKDGRIRGNLMGKRVNYSARTVITPDPSINIDEIGIPYYICKILTFPEKVTHENYTKLQKCIINGYHKYPGAKNIYSTSKNMNHYLIFVNETIRTNYAKQLEIGDIVERHMDKTDYFIFNRQPSLHKMGFMTHRARPMPGKTFRISPDVTGPYNADCDGDEMNLHLPQTVETQNELKSLSYVPYQIISPCQSKPVITIVQDTQVGIYLFSKELLTYLPFYYYMQYHILQKNKSIQFNPDTSKQSLEQLLTNYLFQISVNINKNQFIIKNGHWIHGLFTKDILTHKSIGLIHSFYSTYGPQQTCAFIDSIRFLITHYLFNRGLSVGIRDINFSRLLYTNMAQLVNCGKNKLFNQFNQLHLDNYTCKNNNQITQFHIDKSSDAQHIFDKIGQFIKTNITDNNRLAYMVQAKSKGSDLNIYQIIGCVGQQYVNGNRILFNNHNRTLVHFSQNDDSAESRGFVFNSFNNGLNETEFFYHAMGGREGLIDTAVKTSETGYIQRRLMKFLEDLSIRYDYTVRDVKNRIIQFYYGYDDIDSCQIETNYLPYHKYWDSVIPNTNHPNTNNPISIPQLLWNDYYFENMDYFQDIWLPSLYNEQKQKEMSIMNQVKNMYLLHCDSLINYCKQYHKYEQVQSYILFSIHFLKVIELIASDYYDEKKYIQQSDLTIEQIYYDTETLIQSFNMDTISSICIINRHVTLLVYTYLNPFIILKKYKYNVTKWKQLINQLYYLYQKNKIQPGEMVGVLCAQSIGEPVTQLTLNTFHLAGVLQNTVLSGVPRMKELLNITKKQKIRNTTIYILDEYQNNSIVLNMLPRFLKRMTLSDIIDYSQINFIYNHHYQGYQLEIYFQKELLFNYSIDTIDIYAKLVFVKQYGVCMQMNYMTDQDNHIQLILSFENDIRYFSRNQYDFLQNLLKSIFPKIILLNGAMLININMSEKNFISYNESLQIIESKKEYYFNAEGSDLVTLLQLPFIDKKRIYTNDIWDVYYTYGIEATRNVLYEEIMKVLSDGATVNPRHVYLLVDMMTFTGTLTSVDRHGFNKGDLGILTKASFEETDTVFYKGAIAGEIDNIKGISSNIMIGQCAPCGTGIVELYIDEEFINQQIELLAQNNQWLDSLPNYHTNNLHQQQPQQQDNIHFNTVVTFNLSHNQEGIDTKKSDLLQQFQKAKFE